MIALIKEAHTWNGVSSRKSFWLTILLIVVVSTIITIFGVLVDPVYSLMTEIDPLYWGWPDTVATLATLFASITIFKRRLNDAGWSGWWQLFPILNFVVAGFFKSKTEDNKYIK